MSVEKITKDTFDKLFKNSLEMNEEDLLKASQMYIALIDFRRTYRQDYKTHRINHLFDDETGAISYKKIARRDIGFHGDNK